MFFGWFINLFKEVQRLKTQLDQYTDLTDENHQTIEQIIPKDTLRAFKGMYLETAQRLKEKQAKNTDTSNPIEQLDFEFVLFASALIDYDYIMGLIAENTNPKSLKQKMTKEQLIRLLSSSANLMEERETLTEYINGLDWEQGQDEKQLKQGYEKYKLEKNEKELAAIANKHGVETQALKSFTDDIMSRMIFDGEKLTDLLEPLELSWKERRVKELALMEDLVPQLKKLSEGAEISGLAAYE